MNARQLQAAWFSKASNKWPLDTYIQTSGWNDRDFWNIIEYVGWGRKTYNYREIEELLIGELSTNSGPWFTKTFRKFKTVLDDKINQWERKSDKRLPLGDDGFSDLVSHIIGLGSKEYWKVMRDPELALKRAESGDYKESFSYAIPATNDYGGN